MNISLIKLISILSCFIGGICGLVALLPYIGGLAFLTVMCLASIFVISFLMYNKILQIESIPESITLGGIIGFVSFIAFSIIYIPLMVIMIRGFNYSTNYGVSIFIGHANLFIIVMLVLFLAILSATINAFTGFVVYYISELLKNMNNR